MATPPTPKQPTDAAAPSRSATTLASDVIRQGSNLVQQEVELAKAEMAQKASQLKTAIGEILAGAILVAVSSGILLSALVSGVARLLVAIFGADTGADRELVALDGLGDPETQVVTAVSRNVDAALDAARTLPTYEGLAALLVGLIFAAIGAILLRNGMNKLDPENLVPERSVRQVKKDGDLVQEKI